MNRARLLRLVRFALIVIGVSLALLCTGLAVFLLMLEFFGNQQHPYMAILTLGVLPVAALVGVGLAALGYVGLRGKTGLKLPVVDFNQSGQRRVAVVLTVCIMAVMCGSGFGSYQAYEYTDSVKFCGTSCHVMRPELMAHDQSPHAQVACVECHVGSGASWYVQSKVNGLHQLYLTMRNECPRPIPVPVKNLRPAQDTCMKCHWKNMDYGNQRKDFTYFASDAANTRMDITLMLKIGGDNPAIGAPHGIHWHMNLSNEVTYATLDPKRGDIPWVRVRSRKDGTERIYRNKAAKFTDSDLKKAEVVVMDCTECHNRPAHVFYHPAGAVDRAMASGLIDPTLPNIKEVGVDVLEGPYATQDAGVTALAAAVHHTYADKYPDVARSRAADIDRAIGTLQDLYRRSYFPEMQANWKAYPDHLDHIHTSGCFRCHDNNHKSDDGRTLSQDCTLCHSIVSQTVGGHVSTAPNLDKGLQFAHPSEGDGWKDNDCTDCHGAAPASK